MHNRRQLRRPSTTRSDEAHLLSPQPSASPVAAPVPGHSFDQIALYTPGAVAQPAGDSAANSVDSAQESGAEAHEVRTDSPDVFVQRAAPSPAASSSGDGAPAPRAASVNDTLPTVSARRERTPEWNHQSVAPLHPGHRFDLMRLHDDSNAGHHPPPLLSPVIGQRTSGDRLQRTPAEDLIAEHTSMFNLDEDRLGETLLRRMRSGQYDFMMQVFDALGALNRDDVAYETMRRASEADLDRAMQSAEGRRLLDRLFDELTAGNVAQEEQQEADRIVRARARRMGAAQFEQGMRTAKIFPFRLPGLTVVNDAPILAERRERGRIWVRQPVRVLGTSTFRAETSTLPSEAFTSGIELPEDEVVGVRMYDMGGVTIYRPALFLIQLANTTDTTVLTKIVEVAGIGITLGTGALAGAGAEASMFARISLWADRIIFALGTVASVIAEHRGWIIRRFGASGQRFLRAIEMIQSALYIYNIVSIVRSTPQLVTGLRSSFDDWSAAARGIERELSTAELQTIRTISDETNTILQQCAAVAQAAQGMPQSGSLSSVESVTPAGSTPPATPPR